MRAVILSKRTGTCRPSRLMTYMVAPGVVLSLEGSARGAGLGWARDLGVLLRRWRCPVQCRLTTRPTAERLWAGRGAGRGLGRGAGHGTRGGARTFALFGADLNAGAQQHAPGAGAGACTPPHCGLETLLHHTAKRSSRMPPARRRGPLLRAGSVPAPKRMCSRPGSAREPHMRGGAVRARLHIARGSPRSTHGRGTQ